MIIHICLKSDWEKFKNLSDYVADSLNTQGFIHCSDPDKVVVVANFNFKSIPNLALLLIDESKINSKIIYEDGGSGALYPHVYGPINTNAVVNVVDFPCQKDGTFLMPKVD